MASGDDRAVSDAALWMLLLLRLTAVPTDERLELRNSEFCFAVDSSRLTYCLQALYKLYLEYLMSMAINLVLKHGRSA